MVRLHVKKGEESHFLYDTHVEARVEDIIYDITIIYNGRLKVSRICYGNDPLYLEQEWIGSRKMTYLITWQKKTCPPIRESCTLFRHRRPQAREISGINCLEVTACNALLSWPFFIFTSVQPTSAIRTILSGIAHPMPMILLTITSLRIPSFILRLCH